MKIVLFFFVFYCSSVVWADQTLISTGSSWKYLDNGSNQGTAWRASSFIDASWASGTAELGYGDGGEPTVVNGGPTNNRFATTYFRKTFSIANATLFTSYSMKIKRDDGVVVYVNGTEVYRNNMAAGTVAYNTWASATASDDGGSFLTVTLPVTAFITGTNVIAVEIHQANATSSDISFDLGLTGIESASNVNEVVYQWSGSTKPTSAVVVAKMTTASTTCRLVVSTSATLTNPILSPNATASSSNNLMAKMTVDGLTPNTTYFYAIQSGGTTDNSSDDIGKFITPASGAFSYKFTVASCAVNSNHEVYNLMNAKSPMLHVSTGDLHYANPNSSSDINIHRLPYEQNVLSLTPSRNFFKNCAIAHVWDDHDYCGNNSTSTSVGRTNARLSYQEYVPHYTLAAGSGNVPIYQAFTIGRVHFILSDLRSERISGSIMGSAQKTWFKNQCLFARDNNLIIAWVSGVSFGGNQTDNWGGYTAERTELSNFFRDNNIKNMFILSGDAHMLAIDNGTNHDFSTGSNNPNDYPVFQAAAVNNSGSTKGGTYSEGGTFPNPNSSTGQYGVVEVIDNGGTAITIKFTGYRTSGNTASESVLTTYTFTRTLSPAAIATPEFSVRSLEEGRKSLVSWSTDVSNDEWKIERSANNSSFEEVAKIASNTGFFEDAQPINGWNTYRILDASGTVIGEETIFMTGDMDVILVPNPAKNLLNITIDHVSEAVDGRFIVYNMKMKTVLQGNQRFEKGSTTFTVDVSEFEAGEYLVHLVINGRELTEKLVVVK
jgi:alkaline phosphatase D